MQRTVAFLLAAALVAIRRPGAAFVEDVALQVRLVLDPATTPGAIALPLRVVATPI